MIKPNKALERCWNETSVDLFGSLPSKNHIVVIQDLASRYPTAKLVESNNAKSIISVLEDVYDSFLILRKWTILLNKNIEQVKASLIM